MPAATMHQRSEIRQRYKHCPIVCPRYVDTRIESLSDFFAVFHSLLEPDGLFWFRGHSQISYRLAPGALRYEDRRQRERALRLLSDVRRYLEIKLRRPPTSDDELGWMQVAQHYGLPTRLLDWTHNAAVALFFACTSHHDSDGLVVVVNPIELNQAIDPADPRVFNAHRDSSIIKRYLSLDGAIRRNGRTTIAINPTWNNDRIALQNGAFTLHGSRRFDLASDQASSLLLVPILREFKLLLLNELERVGIGEMFIFPEPEHVCSHLRRRALL